MKGAGKRANQGSRIQGGVGDKGRARGDLKSQKTRTRGVGQSSAALQADEEDAVASVD